eukprot:NODE_3496_length_768_cov_39.351878_g2923_i0.p3 GENE.NODE_3496_length_768_cov_39.351878_g2923_i0~~NODE_3496_length_768_cov_39.351878_g2923_i0.p3  ORF type:complete len:61 (+),score=6.14 NODE_3496_length_768_cov_39.351878_g2923_i0:489-671(+)
MLYGFFCIRNFTFDPRERKDMKMETALSAKHCAGTWTTGQQATYQSQCVLFWLNIVHVPT